MQGAPNSGNLTDFEWIKGKSFQTHVYNFGSKHNILKKLQYNTTIEKIEVFSNLKKKTSSTKNITNSQCRLTLNYYEFITRRNKISIYCGLGTYKLFPKCWFKGGIITK